MSDDENDKVVVSAKDTQLFKEYLKSKETQAFLLSKMNTAHITMDIGWGAGGDGWIAEEFTVEVKHSDGTVTTTDFAYNADMDESMKERYEWLPWPSQVADDLQPLLEGLDWVIMNVEYSTQEYYADEEFGHYTLEGTPDQIIAKLKTQAPKDEDDSGFFAKWQYLG